MSSPIWNISSRDYSRGRGQVLPIPTYKCFFCGAPATRKARVLENSGVNGEHDWVSCVVCQESLREVAIASAFTIRARIQLSTKISELWEIAYFGSSKYGYPQGSPLEKQCRAYADRAVARYRSGC